MGRVPSALEELCQEHPELGRQLPGCAPSERAQEERVIDRATSGNNTISGRLN